MAECEHYILGTDISNKANHGKVMWKTAAS